MKTVKDKKGRQGGILSIMEVMTDRKGDPRRISVHHESKDSQKGRRSKEFCPSKKRPQKEPLQIITVVYF
jgi:hypothetical protein